MKKTILFRIILLIYLILPILILVFPMLFQYKFYILTIVGISIYFILKTNKVSNDLLGIKKENIISSIKRNLPIIILGIVTIILLRTFNLNKYKPTETIPFYIFYIFISCPIQEFLYRSVFGYFDDILIKNKYITILLSSISYSFIHIIYKDVLTLVLTFLFGLILYYVYQKDKNIFGVAISHIIIGILTIYLGIIN